jgi:hypothetical protein
MAIEVMTPRATKGPPKTLVSLKATKYSGMKTLNNPNAISWKKNPNRHIAKTPLQRQIKGLPEQILTQLGNGSIGTDNTTINN